MIGRLLDKLARWYFVNYVRPVAQDWLYAELAKAAMQRNGATKTKRYMGEP